MTHQDLIHGRLDGSLAAIGTLRAEIDRIDEIGRALIDRLAKGGTLFTAGNGGSAAQALHLAEEFIGRYRGRRRALRAVCLNADPTAMSCIANDFGYDHVFARQCEALLGPTDALLVLSTSGNGLLGAGGGRCSSLCDHSVILQETDSAFVQDAHQVVLHLICEMMEEGD